MYIECTEEEVGVLEVTGIVRNPPARAEKQISHESDVCPPLFGGSPNAFAPTGRPSCSRYPQKVFSRMHFTSSQVCFWLLTSCLWYFKSGYGPDSMAVLWTSTDKDSVVRWGTADDSLTNTAEATITEFKAGTSVMLLCTIPTLTYVIVALADILANKRKWYISNATMTGLTPSANYFYQVGASSATSWPVVFCDTMKWYIQGW